ncbi:MAG: hypothetical protein DWQ47_10900 [Acidobacteria bacterium]|nr:MAG: hypothetical protein DWQ32_13315 [Acidobacteriota bacterium]REJ98091.1 MAG: hypothetical protein DWQ38_16115 [Acidobacteriota bacterium]REK16834.1 MAG: hypothetical protein DWQ43_01160 [Acidobacteriota bacterium]REK42745.1 MAG: hypothetical protein DWQ47_10900 [Acidobacteriota bacterium]
MTAKELESQVGVAGIDETAWGKAVFLGLNNLRIGLAAWKVGAAGFGSAAGATGLGGGVAGAVMGVGAIAAPLLGLCAALLSIGLPVAAAKEFVANKAARHGYSIGVALGIYNHNRHFMSTFLDNTMGDPGVAPKYMTGIYKNAFNASLVYGYCTASRLSQAEKKKMGDGVLRIMNQAATRGGYQLRFANERDGIHKFARTFANKVLKN